MPATPAWHRRLQGISLMKPFVAATSCLLFLLLACHRSTPGASPQNMNGSAGHAAQGGNTNAGRDATAGTTVPSAGTQASAPYAGSDASQDTPINAPWTTQLPTPSALRKVKNVLTGLGPSDADLSAAGADLKGLPQLVDAWIATPQFDDKMQFFFKNAFQQSSLAVLDFEFQLRKRPGALDLPYDIYGDDGFPKLFANMSESFARTCLQLMAEGKPFTDVLTTQRFMMTTALKSLYMQIEMPYDIHTYTFQFNQGARPAIEDTLDPKSPNYMIFGYAAPTTMSGRKFSNNCAGDATKISQFPGNTYLFQVLLGAVPRDSGTNSAGTTLLGCMEHPAAPYFKPEDFSDWQMVSIANSGTALRSFDLPALRAATTLSSKLPRVSFFTTPAFLAVWNTNDSNQHRVTANQALLAALGQGFTSASATIPVPPTLTAIDGQHAVSTSVCYGCHKSLDPMRQFWGNFYDYNDRADGKKTQSAASFGFADVAQDGKSLADFGGFLAQVSDAQVDNQPVNRFALAITQKLCFFANSARCVETDPEMRRIALLFQNANYDFKTLVRALFTSPLVTSAADTATAMSDGVTISIARRDQLCTALSNRLKQSDLCDIALPTPTNATSPMNRLAGALPADGFSRGTEFPVTSPDPSLFYRAASELVCEAVAKQVVDGAAVSVYSSKDPTSAVEDMVTTVMGVPASDPNHAAAVSALNEHYTAALGTAKASATNALRSTFSAACQSPTVLSLGI
jgi:hypothetical protein